MTTLNDALKKLEATEANFGKLDRIWQQIEIMLSEVKIGGVISGVTDETAYRELDRQFEHIRKGMPKIDGFVLENAIFPADSIIPNAIDLAELGEINAEISFDKELYKQRDILLEYGFLLKAKRRQLARETVQKTCDEIDMLISQLAQTVKHFDVHAAMPKDQWGTLTQKVATITTLLGGKIGRPPRWDMLQRHISFGIKCDFDDIVAKDWPAVRAGMDSILFGEEDPLPIGIEDIGVLVGDRPRGAIATELKWDGLDDEGFERLIFNLISHTENYDGAAWLTHTNAPDRGRDLSVFRITRDALVAARKERIIIQCKHKKSVNLPDISNTESQMRLWEPPRIDELIIVTSGTYTTDAVQWVESYNQGNKSLYIDIWSRAHLEMLLAKRSELIAEFQLR